MEQNHRQYWELMSWGRLGEVLHFCTSSPFPHRKNKWLDLHLIQVVLFTLHQSLLLINFLNWITAYIAKKRKCFLKNKSCVLSQIQITLTWVLILLSNTEIDLS
jgi:hypothetical protein